MKLLILKFIRRLYKKKVLRKLAKYTEPLKVNGYSFVNYNTYLGANINFNGMKIKGNGKVIIGNNFHSGQECLIITSIHNYDKGKSIPYDETNIDKDITIQDNVWIGDRVIILWGGCIIEEGAIIQAGAVVINNIPRCAIAGGNPAKVFKYRDIEHYEKLKKEQRFH